MPRWQGQVWRGQAYKAEDKGGILLKYFYEVGQSYACSEVKVSSSSDLKVPFLFVTWKRKPTAAGASNGPSQPTIEKLKGFNNVYMEHTKRGDHAEFVKAFQAKGDQRGPSSFAAGSGAGSVVQPVTSEASKDTKKNYSTFEDKKVLQELPKATHDEMKMTCYGMLAELKKNAEKKLEKETKKEKDQKHKSDSSASDSKEVPDQYEEVVRGMIGRVVRHRVPVNDRASAQPLERCLSKGHGGRDGEKTVLFDGYGFTGRISGDQKLHRPVQDQRVLARLGPCQLKVRVVAGERSPTRRMREMIYIERERKNERAQQVYLFIYLLTGWLASSPSKPPKSNTSPINLQSINSIPTHTENAECCAARTNED